MIPAGSVLLDTSVVINHFRGDPRITEALEGAAAIYLPTVALGELYYGAFRSAHREKHFEQVRRFLPAVTVLAVDSQTSEEYGRLRAELAQTGLLIPEKRYLDCRRSYTARITAGNSGPAFRKDSRPHACAVVTRNPSPTSPESAYSAPAPRSSGCRWARPAKPPSWPPPSSPLPPSRRARWSR